MRLIRIIRDDLIDSRLVTIAGDIRITTSSNSTTMKGIFTGIAASDA